MPGQRAIWDTPSPCWSPVQAETFAGEPDPPETFGTAGARNVGEYERIV